MATYFIDPLNGNDANDGGGWWKLAFASGTGSQPVAGETVTGDGGATAKIIKITGTWATSGTLYLYNRNATAFANGEAITFSGGGACVNAQGTPYDSVVASFKTIKKTFAAGDTILAAKSPETALAGTVTATNGSVSVNTTNDLTGSLAQYTIIRIGGDNTLYMVKAITSSVITLYRPYRGVTGSGKTANYFTGLPTSASQDWLPTAMTGTSGSHITVQGGINPATQAQDGFTILYGNNASYCLYGTWTWTDISRVSTLYFGYPWNASLVDCSLTDCFSFRTSTSMALSASWTRVTVNSIVSELGRWAAGINFYNCTINLPETAEAAQPGFNFNSSVFNSVFNQWRNAGYAGQPACGISANIFKSRIVDAILDELASGCTNISLLAGNRFIDYFIFQNPILGSGTAFSIDGSCNFYGKLSLSNVNGSITDHRTYLGNSYSDIGKYSLLSYDASVYNMAAPGAKVSLFQSAHPTMITHYIPCEAGVVKTVSVWLRKNASYGSATLPTMRLRWMTGTAPNLVSNVQDVAMPDVNDAFQQVSYELTPSVQGAIIMDLIFRSANSGAIAWYDNIGLV